MATAIYRTVPIWSMSGHPTIRCISEKTKRVRFIGKHVPTPWLLQKVLHLAPNLEEISISANTIHLLSSRIAKILDARGVAMRTHVQKAVSSDRFNSERQKWRQRAGTHRPTLDYEFRDIRKRLIKRIEAQPARFAALQALGLPHVKVAERYYCLRGEKRRTLQEMAGVFPEIKSPEHVVRCCLAVRRFMGERVPKTATLSRQVRPLEKKFNRLVTEALYSDQD